MVCETGIQNQVGHTKDSKKWKFDAALLNTRHCKDQGENVANKEWSSALPYTLV